MELLVFLAGIKRSHIAYLFGLFLVIAPLMWKFLLLPYQKKRILTLIDPSSDPLGSGYHIIQSKIAVGSGGFFGKGFLNGTFNHNLSFYLREEQILSLQFLLKNLDSLVL